MAIFLTGDWHGINGMERISNTNWPLSTLLTGENYVVVLGDFGVVWGNKTDKQVDYLTKWLKKKPFKVLFVAGNHENFDKLEQYPDKEWKGGVVREISDQIYQLKTGHIFNIEGKKIAVFGGALSVDKEYRINGISWWKQEIPSVETMSMFCDKLAEHDWKVDYLLTHTTSADEIPYHVAVDDKVDDVARFLKMIKDHLDFKHHYFGHMHHDWTINAFKSTCLYKEVLCLGKKYEHENPSSPFGKSKKVIDVL